MMVILTLQRKTSDRNERETFDCYLNRKTQVSTAENTGTVVQNVICVSIYAKRKMWCVTKLATPVQGSVYLPRQLPGPIVGHTQFLRPHNL